MELYTFIGKVN